MPVIRRDFLLRAYANPRFLPVAGWWVSYVGSASHSAAATGRAGACVAGACVERFAGGLACRRRRVFVMMRTRGSRALDAGRVQRDLSETERYKHRLGEMR